MTKMMPGSARDAEQLYPGLLGRLLQRRAARPPSRLGARVEAAFAAVLPTATVQKVVDVPRGAAVQWSAKGRC